MQLLVDLTHEYMTGTSLILLTVLTIGIAFCVTSLEAKAKKAYTLELFLLLVKGPAFLFNQIKAIFVHV